MKKKVNVTLVASIFFLVFGIVILLAIPANIREYEDATDIGPRAFPRLLSIAVIVLSALQIILVLTGVHKGKTREMDIRAIGKVFIAMLIDILGIVASHFVNIVIVAVICGILMLILLGSRKPAYYIAVLVTGGLLFALMHFVMHIRF